MNRLSRYTLCVLCLLGATNLHLTQAESPLPITALPEDYRIWATAETLPALIAKTKPTLSYVQNTGQTMFVWASKTTKGKRFFRLANATEYQPKTGPKQWIVTDTDSALFFSNPHNILPRITITTHGKPPFNSIGAETWWHEVATHPQHGTLYEIEYYYQLAGEAAQGTRLVLLEDPTHHWQYVTETDGNYWDDTAYMDETHLQATWTNNPQEPLVLTETWHSFHQGDESEKSWKKRVSPSNWIIRTYQGKLPLLKPTSELCFLKVRKGDTFSSLMKQFISNFYWQISETENQHQAQILLTNEVRRLNPGLKMDHLLVDQKIILPNTHQQATLFKKFTTPPLTPTP